MNRLVFALLAIGISCNLIADRKLDPAEVDQLLQTLTRCQRQSWMPYGTIQAHHLQYHELQNKITDSVETIQFDGQRYRWQVTLNPSQSLDMNREISERPDQSQTPSEDFLMNQENLYAWNGKKQIRYYKSSDYAIVRLGREYASSVISGPPSAGIIPWGRGDCSLEVLRANKPAAYEITDDQGLRLKLEYIETKYNPHAKVTYLLDPSMDYAVLSYSMENELALLRNTYNEYRLAGSLWVPGKIMIERFDKRWGQPKLISYDDWQFDVVNLEKPAESMFIVNFEPGTIVEMQPSQSTKTFMYQASQHNDIEQLLQDKISVHSAKEQNNCATAAVSHIARRFSKAVAKERLAQMVSDEKGKTALSDVKASLQEIGLECMAVTTDIETLAKISNCVKIVHLPASNHYVIVDRIESDCVWVIDLVNRKFYWRKPMQEFLMEWYQGVALLVSDTVIDIPSDAKFSYLETAQMTAIEGGEFGTYSCTDQIQAYQHILCDQPVGFLCGGAYYVFYDRLGCKEDVNGGTCIGQKLVGYEFTQCINNIDDSCTITGTWESRYIRACQ